MNTDKIVGIATISVVLLIVVYVAFAMWLSEKRARNTVFVQFYEMGSLQNEDVVVIRGLAVGKVASIKRKNDKALAELDLYEPRIFRKDTKFKNISPNIMGSRFISIEPGTKGDLAPEDYVFDGEFEAGMAEVLALTDAAKEQIAILMDFVRVLYSGDENSASLQDNVESILTDCEDLLATLEKALASVDNQTMKALNKVGSYANQISDASITINKTLDTIRTQAQDAVVTMDDIIAKVNKSIAGLGKVLIEFESSPVTSALLDKKDIINDIDSLRSALQAFIGSIDGKGIKIYDEKGKRKSMITLKNLHLFRETARSKAKKRAEQEAKK
ncbi:MAG: MlaD family protein [Fibromonadales bacterium]|nr:MlaD family protein [Fibromonadales bacterium]